MVAIPFAGQLAPSDAVCMYCNGVGWMVKDTWIPVDRPVLCTCNAVAAFHSVGRSPPICLVGIFAAVLWVALRCCTTLVLSGQAFQGAKLGKPRSARIHCSKCREKSPNAAKTSGVEASRAGHGQSAETDMKGADDCYAQERRRTIL